MNQNLEKWTEVAYMILFDIKSINLPNGSIKYYIDDNSPFQDLSKQSNFTEKIDMSNYGIDIINSVTIINRYGLFNPNEIDSITFDFNIKSRILTLFWKGKKIMGDRVKISFHSRSVHREILINQLIKEDI